MKKYIIYGLTSEIEKYDIEFMNKVDFIIEESCNINFYKEKRVKDYNWLLNQSQFFLFISNIINKNKIYKKLEKDGFVENRDFVWAPNWLGDGDIPSCYPMNSWEDNENKYDFSQADGPWDFRYKELLTLMPEGCSSIMDCGAGNMSLKRMIEKNILYYPVDKVQKYHETIVCDFNKGDFPDMYVDVIFLAGILEYIICPEVFLRNVCQRCKTVLMTCCTLYTYPDILSRMLNGWKNHFVMGEIIKMYEKYNFHLTDEIYEQRGGVYLRFDKNLNI